MPSHPPYQGVIMRHVAYARHRRIVLDVYVNVKYDRTLGDPRRPTANMDLASSNPPGDIRPAADTLSIGDLAREFAVTTRTIRFYEDLGLIQPARSGLTRIYSPRDRVRLKLILRGKRIGFSLNEIGEIMDMYDREPGEVGQLEYMLERLATRRTQLLRQRNDIDLTLEELTDIETQCRTQLAAMQDNELTGDKEPS